MSFFKKAFYTLTTLALMQGANCLLDPGSSSNVAVYWGQGQSDSSLAQFCESHPGVDAIQLSFVTELSSRGGYPKTSFANQHCTPFPGTNLGNCPKLGEDIKKCQSQGKSILLSIGGATYDEGGFPSASKATKAATKFWRTFGPKTKHSKHRPFGDAVIDGVDFDLESPTQHLAPFAKRLRKLMNDHQRKSHAKSRKNFYLTAAPQCPFPDKNVGELLDKVHLDAVFVQFYNNPHCGLNAFHGGSSGGGFNFERWNQWAKSGSKNKHVKVLIGAPASKSAAPNGGYVGSKQLGEIVKSSKKFESMGGVMLWDSSHLGGNQKGLLGNLKKLANGILEGVGNALD